MIHPLDGSQTPEHIDRLNTLINSAAAILAGAYGTDTGYARCQVLSYIDAALEAAALSDAIILGRIKSASDPEALGFDRVQ